MEQEPRNFPEGEEPEQLIDPEKAAIPGAEMLADAATGLSDRQRSEVHSPSVAPEENEG